MAETTVEAAAESTAEAMPSWDERSQVLLEQVESICMRGRARQLSYMQAVCELESLRIGKHLEVKGQQSSLAASRVVIQYQTLLRLLDEGRKLSGWGDAHEALITTALDVAWGRLSSEARDLHDRARAKEQEDGFIADCSDPYYSGELTQLVARAFEGSELARRPIRTLFVMGIYPCPKKEHSDHAVSLCAGADGTEPEARDIAFVASRLRAFASELDDQLGERG